MVRVVVLGPTARAGSDWFPDRGRGLNIELAAAARTVPHRLLVVHADLPSLSVDDVEALVAAASSDVAIAADRYLRGTNALAIPTTAGFAFAFGPGSLERHRRASPGGTLVRRPGLSCDVDDIDELALASEAGQLSGWRISPCYDHPAQSKERR